MDGPQVIFKHFRPREGVLEAYDLTKGSTPFDVVNRYYRGKNEWVAGPKGGITYCEIITAKGEIYVGAGLCSVTDAFCFATGRHFAFKDAVKHMMEEKPLHCAKEDSIVLEEGIVAFMMPLEHARTVARYLKTFLNSSTFSDTARNELYKALQYVFVHGFGSKD